MPAYARREIVPSREVGVYHCVARCVRRAFLCGVDSYSDHNYEHRRGWIRERLEQLAAIFAIDVCGYAVMSNHLHLILRARPDLVPDWTEKEVALRWKRLFPSRDPETGEPMEPTDGDVKMIVSNPARVEVLRERLSSLSWFMRGLCEPIARRANREDDCTGRFWEGRFRSQRLIDEGAILAASVYVDLNPIRAGMAETPEQSEFTSAFDRIRTRSNDGTIVFEGSPSVLVDSASPHFQDLPEPNDGTTVFEGPPSVLVDSASPHFQDLPEPNDGTTVFEGPPSVLVDSASSHFQDLPEPNDETGPDAWLCELTIDERPGGAAGARSSGGAVAVSHVEASQSPKASTASRHSGLRASNQGFLPVSLEQYLAILDWTARQLRGASQSAIPPSMARTLDRLGLRSGGWIEMMKGFGQWFKTAVGCRGSLKTLAERRGRAWLHGQAIATLAFR